MEDGIALGWLQLTECQACGYQHLVGLFIVSVFNIPLIPVVGSFS